MSEDRSERRRSSAKRGLLLIVVIALLVGISTWAVFLPRPNSLPPAFSLAWELPTNQSVTASTWGNGSFIVLLGGPLSLGNRSTETNQNLTLEALNATDGHEVWAAAPRCTRTTTLFLPNTPLLQVRSGTVYLVLFASSLECDGTMWTGGSYGALYLLGWNLSTGKNSVSAMWNLTQSPEMFPILGPEWAGNSLVVPQISIGLQGKTNDSVTMSDFTLPSANPGVLTPSWTATSPLPGVDGWVNSWFDYGLTGPVLATIFDADILGLNLTSEKVQWLVEQPMLASMGLHSMVTSDASLFSPEWTAHGWNILRFDAFNGSLTLNASLPVAGNTLWVTSAFHGFVAVAYAPNCSGAYFGFDTSAQLLWSAPLTTGSFTNGTYSCSGGIPTPGVNELQDPMPLSENRLFLSSIPAAYGTGSYPEAFEVVNASSGTTLWNYDTSVTTQCNSTTCAPVNGERLYIPVTTNGSYTLFEWNGGVGELQLKP